MKLKAEEYEPMEVGQYRSRFTGYDEDEGIHGPFLKCHFEILDEEYKGRAVTGLTSTSFNPMSKLWAWVQALLGRPIEHGEELDLDDLVGNECILIIGHRTTDRGIFERVEPVMPIRRKKADSQPAPEVSESDFEDLSF